ncbi:hypothetical protein DVT68_08750 [Dyella solisilvae]|uniref:Vitamin K epoxide reductase domain-containing protein n=1 Tax=Dyella solisilvae TaxID=1920168 RepID=A0A370K7K4_9GAMM|nr:hypothetical protein [Dyella solisilvae]RDI98604.1 hypothetical protein DVT68_08750 [Dyella solisilvae]
MKRTLTLVLPWLLALAVGAAAMALRYGLVESPDVARACETSHALACQLRHLTVLGFITGNIFGWPIGIFGWIALAATVLALVWQKLPLAWLATATGLFAVVLYCFVPGALALLVGSLRLVRLQAGGAAPGDQHRPTERQVYAQP